MNKVCTKCKIEKNITEFNKCSKMKDNHSVYCRSCAIGIQREARADPVKYDRIKASNRRYHAKPEVKRKESERDKERRRDDPEYRKRLIDKSKRYDDIPENKKRASELKLKRLREDNNYRLYNKGIATLNNWFIRRQYTSMALCELVQLNHHDIEVWRNNFYTLCMLFKQRLQFHHIIPVLWFPDLTDRNQLRDAFSPINTTFLPRERHIEIDIETRRRKDRIMEFLNKRYLGGRQ